MDPYKIATVCAYLSILIALCAAICAVVNAVLYRREINRKESCKEEENQK